MVIDAHTHLGCRKSPLWGPISCLPEDLLKLMDVCEIDKFVVLPIVGGFKPEDFKKTNDYSAKITRTYPHRVIGFANINPTNNRESITELERAVVDLGLKGVGELHPFSESPAFYIDSPLFYPFIKKCQNTPQLAEGMNGRGYKGTESPYPCS